MIVLNTLNGAVTEYDHFGFQSITPTHVGSATGLFLLGGDLDVTTPIQSDILTGKLSMGIAQRKRVPPIYYAIEGDIETATCVVATEDTEHEYAFDVRLDGVSRAVPGKGIIENYLQVGLKTDGGHFVLDYIEAGAAGTPRRI